MYNTYLPTEIQTHTYCCDITLLIATINKWRSRAPWHLWFEEKCLHSDWMDYYKNCHWHSCSNSDGEHGKHAHAVALLL